MIPFDEPLRSQIIGNMLKGIRHDFDSLTSWEQEFIESIEEQVENGKRLTTKQAEILERIYDK